MLRVIQAAIDEVHERRIWILELPNEKVWGFPDFVFERIRAIRVLLIDHVWVLAGALPLMFPDDVP